MSSPVTRLVAIALCVGLATAVPAGAWAAPGDPPVSKAPTAEDKRQARKHYKKAQRLFDVGRFREALGFYEKAFDAAPLPGFLFNIGQCHRNLKQYAEAIFSFQRYLRLKPQAKNRAQVEALIDELETKKKKADAEARRRRLLTPTPLPAKPTATPVYKKWWFWTGVAAVTITGTVFVVRSGGSGPSIPASDLGNVDFNR